MATILNQIGSFMGLKDKQVRQHAATLADAARDQAVSLIRGGVSTDGDTLQKLFNLITANRTTFVVANISERDSISNLAVGDFVFVEDDGDSSWALYVCDGTSPKSFVKVSDPDLFGGQLSAADIKNLYESNPNTNAFTDAHVAFLGDLETKLATLNTTHKATYAGAINEVLGVAESAAATASGLDGRLSAVEGELDNLGTYADFEAAFNAAAS